MKKLLKKALCGALAITSAVASVGLFTACETKTPEVEMQLSFNGQKYTLEYTLYREVAPNTVAHFLALAENEYYNELCMHDYTAARMVGGVYSYVDGGENGGLVYKDYYATVKADTFKNFHHSVWADEEQTMPTYTLYGEFDSNNFKAVNNPLKQSLGALSTFYNEKDTEAKVVVNRADGEGISWKPYKYNSATSAFSISVDPTEKALAKVYCTFGELDADSKDEFNALLEAIDAYIVDNYGDSGTTSDFTERESILADEGDAYVEDGDYYLFNIPKEPIKINYVKVKKF
jgi:cyclophilin family peptidyl-prolyl cis-trans isomerase